jgi:Tfp pilus assembly protein PilF
MEEQIDEPESLTPRVTRTRPPWVFAVLGVILVAVVAGGYWLKTRPAPDVVRATPSQATPEALMKMGVDMLYVRNDPTGAAVQFRQVLAMNPGHYGATYQLAVALDRSGKPGEARVYWEKMLPMAEAAKDETTAATVRKRLDVPPPTSEEGIQQAIMRAGLDAMYVRKDPAAAAAEFRKVLARNPAHYGATYQLAAALDRSGKRAEARPLWEKVVKMAEGYKDQRTLDTARARLAQKP